MNAQTNAQTGPHGVQSWDEVKTGVARDDSGKWDRVVPRDELYLDNGRLAFPRRYAMPGAMPSLALTDWTTLQLCQRLAMPAAYFRKCPAPLRDAQANHWLRHPEAAAAEEGKKRRLPADATESRWLLRAKGQTLRGLLSERYAKVGNADLVRVLEPAVREAGYAVRWFALTDESLHLRLVDPRRAQEVLPGDPVIVGLHLTNSEVGKRSVSVDTLVWRLVCRNGLVRLVKGKSLYARRHLGVSAVPELAASLPEVIRRAVHEGDAVVERMRRATDVRLTDPRGVVTTIASDWALGRAVEERIAASLAADVASHQDTLYGLVNAVTHVAQGLDPDERFALESLAGALLEAGPPAVRAQPRLRAVAAETDAEVTGGETRDMNSAGIPGVPAEALRPSPDAGGGANGVGKVTSPHGAVTTVAAELNLFSV